MGLVWSCSALAATGIWSRQVCATIGGGGACIDGPPLAAAALFSKQLLQARARRSGVPPGHPRGTPGVPPG